MHACYLLDRSIGSFGCIIFLLLHLNLEVVLEGGEFSFSFEFGHGDVLFEVVGDVGLGDVDKMGVFGVVVFLCCLFGRLGGIFGGACVGNVCSFNGPCGKWLVFRGSRVGNVSLKVLLNKLDVGIDPCLNAGIFVKDLLVN